jgi:hypothetical protein
MIRTTNDAEAKGALVLGQHNVLEVKINWKERKKKHKLFDTCELYFFVVLLV